MSHPGPPLGIRFFNDFINSNGSDLNLMTIYSGGEHMMSCLYYDVYAMKMTECIPQNLSSCQSETHLSLQTQSEDNTSHDSFGEVS